MIIGSLKVITNVALMGTSVAPSAGLAAKSWENLPQAIREVIGQGQAAQAALDAAGLGLVVALGVIVAVIVGLCIIPIIVGQVTSSGKAAQPASSSGGFSSIFRVGGAVTDLAETAKWVLYGLGGYMAWKYLGPHIKAGVQRLRGSESWS